MVAEAIIGYQLTKGELRNRKLKGTRGLDVSFMRKEKNVGDSIGVLGLVGNGRGRKQSLEGQDSDIF